MSMTDEERMAAMDKIFPPKPPKPLDVRLVEWITENSELAVTPKALAEALIKEGWVVEPGSLEEARRLAEECREDAFGYASDVAAMPLNSTAEQMFEFPWDKP